MLKRTTIEIDQELLGRAKRALGATTTRATVEESLRRVAESAEADEGFRADSQRQYLNRLATLVDASVLAGEDMWH